MRYTRSFQHALPSAVRLLVGALTLVLSACGGGYGSSSATGTGCGAGGGYGGSTSCPAPTVTLAPPAASVSRTVTLRANAAASGGATVTDVNFMVDGASVGTAPTAPYTVSWDSTTVSDGSHTLSAVVSDSQGQTTTSNPISVKVVNDPVFSVAMAASQIFPVPKSTATGTADLSAKLGTGAVRGKVNLSGVTATAVTINEAFAGTTGASLISLTANASTPGEWDVPSGALLTADQVTSLLEGKLYLIAASAANPGGEIRGQIVPDNLTVIFANLSGAQEVPQVTIAASGVAATTVDTSAATLTVHVNSTGVDDATAAGVNTAAAGAIGPRLVALSKDSVNPGHWSTELASISAADVNNFKANNWYVNVVTPGEPSGAIRGQISTASAPPSPPPATPTLTQLTTTVFAVCGNCHTGGGTSLPASMNLTPGNIYASIVSVQSVEQPALKRVSPGNPDQSYVVQKLEGAPTINGARMPFGGPYLDQSKIDQLRAWISAGAANN